MSYLARIAFLKAASWALSAADARCPNASHRAATPPTIKPLLHLATFISRDLHQLLHCALALGDRCFPHLRAFELRMREPHPPIARAHHVTRRLLAVPAKGEVRRAHNVGMAPAIRRDPGNVARRIEAGG